MCIVASTLELSHCSHWFDGNTEQWWLKTQKPSNPIHSVLMYTKVQNLEVLFFSFPFPFLFLFLFIFGVFFLTQPREKWLCNGKTYNFSLIHLLSENHYCCCSKQQCSIKLNCWKVFKFEIYPGLFQINMELIHITIGTTFIIFITD
jgi:hypothetical protein